MDVTWKKSRRELDAVLAKFFRVLANKETDHWGILPGLHARIGTAFLRLVTENFREKMVGGQGTDGTGPWRELSPKTIRRRLQKNLSRAKESGKASLKGHLPRLVRQLRGILMAKFSLTPEQSELIALAQVDTLHDGGDLLESLRPGEGAERSGATDQVFEAKPGFVKVGVKGEPSQKHPKGKPWHHAGATDGHFPARPYWPASGDLPETWWVAISKAYSEGLAWALRTVLEQEVG
jgi:hypothetical protein